MYLSRLMGTHRLNLFHVFYSPGKLMFSVLENSPFYYVMIGFQEEHDCSIMPLDLWV